MVLAWVLVFGFDDVVGLPATFLLTAVALIAGAVVLGTVLAPGPWFVKTAAEAVPGIRNAAPILAVIAVAFADRPGVLPAVAAVVVVELALQVTVEPVAGPATGQPAGGLERCWSGSGVSKQYAQGVQTGSNRLEPFEG